jgi:phage/plasmid-like protein (TIGR03299 family)
MAHELEVVNGKAQMAYAGELPWHGLGVKIPDNLTPEEIMKVAGLDWEVNKQDVFYLDSDGQYQRAPKKQALVRSSDGKYLDVVSDNWNPVQNKDAFEFFDEYVTSGGMQMHTAGSLRDGKIIWALAKVNDSFDLFGGKDQVDSYLLLSNPHQFGRGVDVRFTPIRVVCNNTLTLSLNGKTNLGISLNHSAEFTADRAKAALAEASQKLDTYKDMAQFLSKKRYNQQSLMEYFARVFPKSGKKVGVSFDKMMRELKDEKKKFSRNAEEAMVLIHEQPGAELGEGTWWSAYNTITYMTNHTIGHNTDTRMQSLWYGSNKDRNVEALGLAIEYAEDA